MYIIEIESADEYIEASKCLHDTYRRYKQVTRLTSETKIEKSLELNLQYPEGIITSVLDQESGEKIWIICTLTGLRTMTNKTCRADLGDAVLPYIHSFDGFISIPAAEEARHFYTAEQLFLSYCVEELTKEDVHVGKLGHHCAMKRWVTPLYRTSSVVHITTWEDTGYRYCLEEDFFNKYIQPIL